MADIIAACGLFFCRLLDSTGLNQFAPGVCFGGDTSAIGGYAVILGVFILACFANFLYRVTQSSAVLCMFVTLTVVAVLSVLIVQYVEYAQ